MRPKRAQVTAQGTSKNLGAQLEKRGFGEGKSNGIEYRLGLSVRLSNDLTWPPTTPPKQSMNWSGNSINQ